MTSGWQTERVYSYNPGACTGPTTVSKHKEKETASTVTMPNCQHGRYYLNHSVRRRNLAAQDLNIARWC